MSKQVNKSLLIKLLQSKMRGQYALCLRSSSFNRLPKHSTIDYACSSMSVLLVDAERLFAFSVQRVHRFAFRSHVDRTLVAAWRLWSTVGFL
jgi:hypothetical protein